MSTKVQIEAFITFLNAHNELNKIDKQNIDDFIYHVERFECNKNGKVKFEMFEKDISTYINVLSILCPSITFKFKQHNDYVYNYDTEKYEYPIPGYGYAKFYWTPCTFFVPKKYVDLVDKDYDKFYNMQKKRLIKQKNNQNDLSIHNKRKK